LKKSKALLIAEIGNNHFGNFREAKELIKVAKESGADLVKGQAFVHYDLWGSMPQKFYAKCQFTFDQYVDLIYYARDVIGIEFFYSIMSESLYPLRFHQRYHKLAAVQTIHRKIADLYQMDSTSVFMSIGGIPKNMPPLYRANILWASSYNEVPSVDYQHLEILTVLRDRLKRPLGYSDHSLGVGACIKAIKDYQVPVVEKHITLYKSLKWDNMVFRDTLHGATPDEFERLAKEK